MILLITFKELTLWKGVMPDLAGLPKNHQMMKKLGINGFFCLFKVLGIQSLSSIEALLCCNLKFWKWAKRKCMKDCPQYWLLFNYCYIFYWNTYWEPLWRREVYVMVKNYIHVKIFWPTIARWRNELWHFALQKGEILRFAMLCRCSSYLKKTTNTSTLNRGNREGVLILLFSEVSTILSRIVGGFFIVFCLLALRLFTN